MMPVGCSDAVVDLPVNTLSTEPLDWQIPALQRALSACWPQVRIECVPSVDSSNTALMTRADGAAQGPWVLVAEHQTAGRGRLGRMWQSRRGDSLTFSVAQAMPAAACGGGLSLALGVALAEALDPRVSVKWPNDLWCVGSQGQWGKLGGVLMETAALPDGRRWLVVGVGLNVRHAPTGLQTSVPGGWGAVSPAVAPAVALSELARTWTVPQALHRLLGPVLTVLQSWTAPRAAGEHRDWMSAYAGRDILAGRGVEAFLATGQTLRGIARGVTPQGALRVEDATGNVHIVMSAEVSIRPC